MSEICVGAMANYDDLNVNASIFSPIVVPKPGRNIVHLEFHVNGEQKLNEDVLTEIRQLQKTLKRQTAKARILLPTQVKLTHYLESEVARLQKQLLILQTDNLEAKRKRWCHLCEKEATFMESKHFYCSQRCQLTYKTMLNSMKNDLP